MQKIRVSGPVFDLLDIHSIEQSGEAVESLLLIGCSRKIAPLRVNSLAPLCVSSLSIRRFWGKGEKWKRKRKNLLSPNPVGRPDTQASVSVVSPCRSSILKFRGIENGF